MSEAVPFSAQASAPASSRVSALVELTKPRIAALVLVTTSIGFYVALPVGFDGRAAVRLIAALIATALVAGGSSALNQFLEVVQDSRMRRTQERPLPSGRLSGAEVWWFGWATAFLGCLLFAMYVNWTAAATAACTFAIYVGAYTPLKRTGSLGVLVGAIAGALPPVIGWASAAGTLSSGAWLLFLILFFWQMPHFAAIAWLYRDDYARAGYPFLPVVDQVGTRTNLHVVTHLAALLIASVLPYQFGLVGVNYLLGAMVLGLGFLAFALMFMSRKSSGSARRLVIASVVYLPALFALMLVDKV